MFSENRIGNRNVHYKPPIVVFQINSISLIESEEFRAVENPGGRGEGAMPPSPAV